MILREDKERSYQRQTCDISDRNPNIENPCQQKSRRDGANTEFWDYYSMYMPKDLYLIFSNMALFFRVQSASQTVMDETFAKETYLALKSGHAYPVMSQEAVGVDIHLHPDTAGHLHLAQPLPHQR